LTNINIVIIDDEPLAIDNIKLLLAQLPYNFNLMATANNVISGIKVLIRNKPDLVFLDITMPDGTGFDILETINNPEFKTIFVTAHSDKAIKAIKNKAYDYLVKPLYLDELQKAISRFVDDVHSKKIMPPSEKIAFNTANEVIYLFPNEISFCKSNSNYTEVYLKNDEYILVSKTLKSVELGLNLYNFFRCHQSYLVNMNMVKRFLKTDGYLILNSNKKIPVSNSKRAILLKVLKQ